MATFAMDGEPYALIRPVARSVTSRVPSHRWHVLMQRTRGRRPRLVCSSVVCGGARESTLADVLLLRMVPCSRQGSTRNHPQVGIMWGGRKPERPLGSRVSCVFVPYAVSVVPVRGCL